LALVLLEGGHNELSTLCSAILQARHGIWPDEQAKDALAAYVCGGEDIAEIVSGLLREGECGQAETILRAYLQVQEVAVPQRSWPIAITTSLLGAALAGQSRFEEAEPLLLDAYVDLEDHPDTPAERLHEAAERLVELYDAWDKPGMAAEWRETLSPAPVATEDQHEE
jgi:hypothetical protein